MRAPHRSALCATVQFSVGPQKNELMTISIAGWALIVSLCSLAVSAAVAYLTLVRKGRVLMTQPTTIYFGEDGGRFDQKGRGPKVFLRTLLYSTAKRGNVVSSLHVRLTRGESIQAFNVWVYGDDKLTRGSGLYVGEQGVVTNHHFLPPKDGGTFRFLPGRYKLELFVARVDHTKPELLWNVNLELPKDLVEQMQIDPLGGIYFDWQPNSQSYHPHPRANEAQQSPPADVPASAALPLQPGRG